MKFMHVIIFFAVFFAIYGSANYYVFIRGWQVLPNVYNLRILYLVAFLFVSFSYIGGRLLGRYTVGGSSQFLTWVGSFWFAISLYLFLIIVFVDLLRLSNYFFHWFPAWITLHYEGTKQITALFAIIVTTTLNVVGYINARSPHIRDITINIAKPTEKLRSLSVAVATDIHLGAIVGNSQLTNLVDMINGINPDIVFLAGDIVDEDIRPVMKENMGEILKNIRSRYGTYAVTGNHEYYSGVEETIRYLTDHGVSFLRDSAIVIDDTFVLVGREDRTLTQMTGLTRKPLGQILAGFDKKLPILMMDHQPLGLSDAIENKVDLQVSGHTHNGQIWPIQFITHMIFELSWGFKKIGDTNFYVSCGYGTWGPPVRLVNQPEVVHITVIFGSGTSKESHVDKKND